ncbi:MAG: ribonuclease D, partial [Candidatus Ratteibacteria bacterium]
MAITRQPEYLMVETPQGLREACAIISGTATVALDMEADTLFHYGETACLAQLSDGAQIWLVDLRRMTDISLLKPILENTAVEKVLHGADYDIRLLRRHFGINCRPIFDTEIAARFL